MTGYSLERETLLRQPTPRPPVWVDPSSGELVINKGQNVGKTECILAQIARAQATYDTLQRAAAAAVEDLLR